MTAYSIGSGFIWSLICHQIFSSILKMGPSPQPASHSWASSEREENTFLSAFTWELICKIVSSFKVVSQPSKKSSVGFSLCFRFFFLYVLLIDTLVKTSYTCWLLFSAEQAKRNEIKGCYILIQTLELEAIKIVPKMRVPSVSHSFLHSFVWMNIYWALPVCQALYSIMER